MSWLWRHRLRSFVAGSMWLVPFVAMLLGIVAVRAAYVLDGVTRWELFGFGAAGGAALVGALSTAMLTFVVFVFSFAMLTVQVASAQLSPRIIAFAFRDRPNQVCLGLFVFNMVFALGTTGRIGERVPQLMVALTGLLSVASVAAFLFLGDRLVRRLRPISVAAMFGELGAAVIDAVYPERLESLDPVPAPAAAEDRTGDATRVIANEDCSSVLLAFDVQGLVALAARADAMIELVPQVGDFVPRGAVLFRVHEHRGRVDDEALGASVAFGPERTLEQDPLFAFRILADIAEKALSPAINDPTTAVLVLDQLHHLLRLTGGRRLSDGRERDPAGALRLEYRTPEWDDFVSLAVTEIRQFGASSFQVARRLRMMLEDLIATLPKRREASLRAELTLLDAAIGRSFADPVDRERAAVADSQGVGSPRRHVASARQPA